MNSYLKGGLQGAIFGGLIVGIFLFSDYLAVYAQQESPSVLWTIKDISELFLWPAYPFAGWGMPFSIFITAAIVIYFLLGMLILGNYYKWRKAHQY
jgi:hypothetical protein